MRFLMILMISIFASTGFAAGKKATGGGGAKAAASKSGGKSGREKNIVREGASKRGDRTKVDFEETDIDGQRKLPLGSLINNSKSDKNYDFVKIRLRWHPEMVQSASSLDSGRSLK